MIRMRYIFKGFVQGVGFRYRAYTAANSLGLTGWVRNESDGSVKMEVQGERNGISSMLKMIENNHFIKVEGIDSREIPCVSSEKNFAISY